MKSYEQAIRILGTQAYHLYMQGCAVWMPDGISTVTWIYDKEHSTVESDVRAYMNTLVYSRLNLPESAVPAVAPKTVSADRPAYYDNWGGSMCNGLGREYF